MSKIKKPTLRKVIAFVATVFIIQAIAPLATSIHAAPLSNTYLRLSRMKAATPTDMRLVFKTSSVNGTENKLTVKMTHVNDPVQTDANNRFTVNTTQTASSASCAAETGATALPGTLTAAGDDTSGIKTITLSGLSDLSTSTFYCVDLTDPAAVTNPVNTGQYLATITTRTAASAAIDTVDIGTSIITDDQVVVSAVVPPIFNFALSGNTDSFQTLLDISSVVSTSGRTATITTNASKGWIAWVRDTDRSGTSGLNSATAPYTINTAGVIGGAAASLTPGSEGYALDVDLTTDAVGGGAVTIDPAYNGSDTLSGGTLSSSYRPVASATGTANGDVITMIERATIAASTPAGNDYTDTLSVVAAGNF